MKHTILLRSGWQTVNIGDIAHTPGVVQVLRRHLDDPHIILWSNPMERRVVEMLQRRLPGIEIIEPADPFQVNDAIDRADLFLHGSAAGVGERHGIEHRWLYRTDKPFGLFGVTIQNPDTELVELLNQAAFIFTRETHSLERLKATDSTDKDEARRYLTPGAPPKPRSEAPCTCPNMRMTPDGVFAMDIRDDETAQRTMNELGLEPGRFICAIPRLRYTPYHHIRDLGWSREKIREVEAVNDRHKMEDHARLREPIIRWVRETGMKVLVCPEMSYQLEILDPLVVDPLPSDVAQNVVSMRRWWLTDEAQAIYAQARCVLSLECHSPIMAINQHTPAFYIRQAEDSIKGQMYYDLGLDDWVFELDCTDPAAIADKLMDVHNNYGQAQAYAAAAIQRSEKLHAEAMGIVRDTLEHGH